METYASVARVGGPYPSPRPVKAATKMPTEKIALVVWADAHMGEQGWQPLEEYKDGGEELVYTVGFLIPEGMPGSKVGHVTLWQTLSDDEGLHPMHIPSGMVRETIFLSAPVNLKMMVADERSL